MWPRSWRLGLETVLRHINVSSRTKSQMPRFRLGLGSERLVHMSIIYTFWNCRTAGSYKLHSQRFAVLVTFCIVFFILYLGLLPILVDPQLQKYCLDGWLTKFFGWSSTSRILSARIQIIFFRLIFDSLSTQSLYKFQVYMVYWQSRILQLLHWWPCLFLWERYTRFINSVCVWRKIQLKKIHRINVSYTKG